MARFFVTKDAVKENRIEITKPDDIHHISKVLRLEEGGFIDVSDSEEYEYRVELVEISREMIVGLIQDKQSFSKEPGIVVSLYQGIPKQAKMESVIQKTVELGVHRIVPVFTARTVVTDSKGNFAKKIERWQKISAEAVKQCKRGIVPQVEPAVDFKQMMNTVFLHHDLVLFLYENEQATTIKQALREFAAEWTLNQALSGMGEAGLAAASPSAASLMEADPIARNPSIALLVGPEGGFSDEEAEALKASSAKCATLGRTILRTETAGMAALAMVMYELEL